MYREEFFYTTDLNKALLFLTNVFNKVTIPIPDEGKVRLASKPTYDENMWFIEFRWDGIAYLTDEQVDFLLWLADAAHVNHEGGGTGFDAEEKLS